MGKDTLATPRTILAVRSMAGVVRVYMFLANQSIDRLTP